MLTVKQCSKCRCNLLVADMPESGPVHCEPCLRSIMCPPAAIGVANHPSCSIRRGIENSLMELSLAERGFVRCSWCRATTGYCDHCQSWHDSAERERSRLSSLLTTYDKIERGLLVRPALRD